MKKLISLLMLSLSMIALVSCDKEDITIISLPVVDDTVTVNFKGQIAISKENVHDGENVNVSVTNIEGLDVLNKTEYKNKPEYAVEVEYFIDNKSIGKSSDMTNGFAFNYDITGLTIGSHTLSATCKGGSKIKLNTTITQKSFVVEEERIDVNFGLYFHMTTDLFEFVTPIFSYTDAFGEHKDEITQKMCEEDSFTVDGISYYYSTRRWDIHAFYIPAETNTITLSFVKKETASADPNKRYYLDEGFKLDGSSYLYHGQLYTDSSMSFNLNIDININVGRDESEPNDGLIAGKYVDEYIKQLCETKNTITVVLGKDGKLNIK